MEKYRIKTVHNFFISDQYYPQVKTSKWMPWRYIDYITGKLTTKCTSNYSYSEKDALEIIEKYKSWNKCKITYNKINL